ncbi:YjgF-like protein [Glarea lozoyensis ATCC 20868]|uniref:YjgF-like protein n=1 Tax=Glarea lozoyensis (strain ATCC 20868 / MF5171) TaxID=1116229 RepID=S3CZ76_GLAL2|nr:YjgF-like protein [Glarea lozoyensis ATCC 20868]EPE25151.1 YjgF-like protein [Glarea lozoyensis ATCC 20868]
MSHLTTYTSYEGYGERSKKNLWYSQAVRIGETIECSGQGGWDRETDKIPTELNAQIAKAFDNVEHTVKTAGGRGWEDVYFVRSYHVAMNDEAMATMVKCLKQYAPNHQPAWTAIGVAKLAFDDMRVEIEVRAHVPADRK